MLHGGSWGDSDSLGVSLRSLVLYAAGELLWCLYADASLGCRVDEPTERFKTGLACQVYVKSCQPRPLISLGLLIFAD